MIRRNDVIETKLIEQLLLFDRLSSHHGPSPKQIALETWNRRRSQQTFATKSSRSSHRRRPTESSLNRNRAFRNTRVSEFRAHALRAVDEETFDVRRRGWAGAMSLDQCRKELQWT